MRKTFDASRRQFFSSFVLGGLASGLALFGHSLVPAQVWAGGAPMLDPNDPLPKTMGYHPDAKEVDAKKWPKIKESPGQLCSNCQFFTDVGKPQSLCSIFPGKMVRAKGWCNTWIKRAG